MCGVKERRFIVLFKNGSKMSISIFCKKKWKVGVFCKKVDLSSTQGALCIVSVFFYLTFYLFGGRMHPTHPPAYGSALTLNKRNWTWMIDTRNLIRVRHLTANKNWWIKHKIHSNLVCWVDLNISHFLQQSHNATNAEITATWTTSNIFNNTETE